MKPTTEDAMRLVRESYGLSYIEARDLLRIPLHPEGLLDRFAAQAMHAIMQTTEWDKLHPDWIAKHAYSFARAMAKYRSQNQINEENKT